ncbi:TetR/AcrR family transcriptional regulator [Streptacidiphilus sp. ASG 303]|uniref:SACE_7040 family transcriptional regulator n=1 Tax=Streptacidiphilus sp. ASG 303 TaxID=2896847 RepID=UPI001E4999D0|nr:TetR/AcrR family transcriptional regulator [Streptacidiphilus sp. ASG 303]MCD0483347.1 TetR/AcrR family transcriptional regulator [Streptacidiphilus sp. ASG 303]
MSRTDAPAATPRRDQIRREAARLFAARGFLGVGVDEIGRAVGISGPGLYRHFAGKDAMLADLLVGISERLLDEGRRRAEDAPGAAAALDALVRGHIDFALDDQDLITLHDRELLHLKDEDRRRVRRLQRSYVELWVDVVRRAFPAPSPLAAEPGARAAVHAVFGLLNSTPHSAVRRGAQPALGRDAMAALLHRLALGALAAAAGTDGGAPAPVQAPVQALDPNPDPAAVPSPPDGRAAAGPGGSARPGDRPLPGG